MNNTKQDAKAFFYEHAGHSYDPAKETSEQGRMRCASQLAQAEAYASANGWEFEWTQDYDSGEQNTVWQCIMFDSESGEVLASLHSIDLGNDTPFPYAVGILGAPNYKRKGRPAYCRVVEAELALEAMP